MRFCLLHVLLCTGVTLSPGCSSKPTETITVATTTSTRDSGLMDTLVLLFENKTGISVKTVVAGTGQAIKIGRRGDADLLLTHAPDAEKEFVEQGFGKNRQLVMYNDFVLVGPKDDPALVKNTRGITHGFAAVADFHSPFISRGDNSGTHIKEQAIWKKAGIKPDGDWYITVGAGMAQSLQVAFEKRGYTLTDRGTYLVHRDRFDLDIVAQGDEILRNEYAVTLISPAKHPHVNKDGAKRFADFLLSSETQNVIEEFGVAKFGEPLFFPASAIE